MDITRAMMKISDIHILRQFSNSVPNEHKMEMCRQYYREHGHLDRDIVVNKSGFLKDGYIGFLVLAKNNIEETEVIMLSGEQQVYKQCKTIYVFGRHDTTPKEYCWRVTDKTQGLEALRIGNKALVNTRRGAQKVTIVRVEEHDVCPYNKSVRGVIRCLDE